MARQRHSIFLVLCTLLVTTGCGKLGLLSQKRPESEKAKVNQPPGKPNVNLKVVKRSPEEAYVAVQFTAPSTDAENDKIAYTYKWYRNGEPMTFPTTQTDTVSKMGPDTNPDPFAVNATEITWKVFVTPRDAYGVGTTAEASSKFKLVRGCEPFAAGYIFVDCAGENIFSTPVTETISVASNARAIALQNVIAQDILGADGTPGHWRFRNFTDLLLKRAFSKPVLQSLPFDPNSYQYTGSLSELGRIQLLDRVCIDIPLVGSACLNEFLYDVDNEPGLQVMDIGPVAASRTAPWSTPVSEASPSENGTATISSLGGNLFEVTLKLNASQVDLLFEPPIDPMLKDIPNSSANYLPELDLSNYLKEYGHAQLGTAFELKFLVDVPSSFDHLDFMLRTFRYLDSDFQFVFLRGPFCNNNLGTTEGPLAGIPYRLNPLDRPFDSVGNPLYSGLISDTESGVQGDGVLVEYDARDNWPYPHTVSNLSGGSGVGRDRIGVNSVPYSFDLAQGMFSDNPNNCARPADACTVAGIQDGGVEWIGISAFCEYPNVSNNSDDSTYKMSSQITSIIPYIQWVFKMEFDHEFLR
jgi:hypothetical protein